MADDGSLRALLAAGDAPRRRSRASKRFRGLKRSVKRLLRGRLVTRAASRVMHGALVMTRATQSLVPGSSDWTAVLTEHHPAIVGLWHGQHLLAPFFRPPNLPYIALLSRNFDAELNAAVVERFGIATVRGSGGRVRQGASKKGGARALIVLRRSLGLGSGVCMIADVPKGTPRDAGLGIVTLARMSGRPIIPSAAVTSRRHVIESSWDKTTVPLPFGRIAVAMGEPIFVPADAGPDIMEEKRLALTLAIETANRRALALADGTGADGIGADGNRAEGSRA